MCNFFKPEKLLYLFFVIALSSYGQVKLPKLISDGMVLQRDANVKIWGWASAGEKVSIRFLNLEYSTTTDPNGDWEVILPPMNAGGPYQMQIDASNSVTIYDILIGDIWLCCRTVKLEIIA